jgi:hypothetical protein
MDLQQIALNGLSSSCSMFLQDLQALPDDAFDKKFGDKTRTVADIVYEVNLVNDHIGMVIRGEKPFDWPEGAWIYAPEDFRTKQAVVEGFEKSSGKIMDTVKGFSPEDMEKVVQTEHGERTRFQRVQFMSWHVGFHSGQLNFIQTLLGDDGWHWS